MRYEYIRIELDFGDLSELNKLSSHGWRAVSVVENQENNYKYWCLLERPLGPTVKNPLY
jgi:hypothetical protein